MYNFALNINSDNQELTPENGISIDVLCPLALELNKAISGGTKAKSILTSIENHGYTPNFTTGSKDVYENFISVHKHIAQRSLGDLTRAEKSYAETLKKFLGKNLYVQPLDEKKEPFCKIYSEGIGVEAVSHFYAVKNRFGVIIEIGSPSISSKTHIYVHGLDYKIYISEAQDAELKHHYRDTQSIIDFKLKEKISVKTGDVMSANLLSYKARSKEKSLYEALNSIDKEDITFLNGVEEHEEIIRLLRS